MSTTYGIVIQTVVWDSRGQHEYLLIYNFELKSAQILSKRQTVALAVGYNLVALLTLLHSIYDGGYAICRQSQPVCYHWSSSSF